MPELIATQTPTNEERKRYSVALRPSVHRQLKLVSVAAGVCMYEALEAVVQTLSADQIRALVAREESNA